MNTHLVDGFALAKLLPADPAVWFDAALDAKLDVSISGRRTGFAMPDDPRQDFLIQWMNGTGLDGWRTLRQWMLSHGITRTI